MLNLKIVKKGEAELPGLTDDEKPRMRGPKRASKIRKLFNLTKVGSYEGEGKAGLLSKDFGARKFAGMEVSYHPYVPPRIG